MRFRSLVLTSLGLLASAAVMAAPTGASGLSKVPTGVFAVTADHVLIHFDPADPVKLHHRVAISGLAEGEALLGIDFRVARGVLYALGSSGQLYTVNTTSGALTAIGDGKLPIALPEGKYGFDFNPAADRIRVVSGSLNLRLHPDTGAAVDSAADKGGFQADGTLRYAEGDAHAGQTPDIVAAGYTYNADNEKLTTNYAIDAKHGTLVIQGSIEGEQPVVSPNTGVLTTIGGLGLGPLHDAHFDISDITNTALAAVPSESGVTQLYRVDLKTGKATPIGPVGDGGALRGLAIEP
ncbi:MAG: DUF4394 domain-containing protein [Zoogloeaceae bacterium]|nr:DUF4394 domain-containing protein [Zoogloeaceae bacterium]